MNFNTAIKTRKPNPIDNIKELSNLISFLMEISFNRKCFPLIPKVKISLCECVSVVVKFLKNLLKKDVEKFEISLLL